MCLNSKKLSSKLFRRICLEILVNINITVNIDKKRFLGKANHHNNHCMINMGGQRPNCGGNSPLTTPYLQLCDNVKRLKSLNYQ